MAIQDADVTSLVAIYLGQKSIDVDTYMSVRVNGFALDQMLDDYEATGESERALVSRYRSYADILDQLLAALGACVLPDPPEASGSD